MSDRHSTLRPVQTIPLSQKLSKGKKGKDWREGNVDYFSDSDYRQAIDEKRYDRLYRLAEGYIDSADYLHVTNRVKSSKGKPIVYPSKLRHYDIISPIVQLLMGEKIKRKIKPMVYAVNSDITTVKEQQERILVQDQLSQMLVNHFNENGLETGYDSRDLITHEEILNKVDSVKDDMAMTGQQSLNYILQYNELDRHTRKSWFDFVSVASCSSYKDVFHNNTYYRSLSPRQVSYICSQDMDFIEDGEAACARMYMTPSEIIDMFHDEMTETQLTKLQERYDREVSYSRGTLFSDPSQEQLYNKLSEEGYIHYKNPDVSGHNVEVSYVNWKSLIKIGKVTGVDVFGQPYEFEIEEGFKPRPDEEVEWKWVNQVWEGYRIETEDSFDPMYLSIRPIPFQRASFDNPSECKLLINGRNVFSRNYRGKSIVEKLEPYQISYNIIKWHIEKLINKNKDKVIFFPYDLVPDNDDMDVEDMLYFTDADGFLFTEENLDSSQVQQMQKVQVLDLSLSQYIIYLKDLLVHLKTEAEETIGITRQRKGQVYASDGKGSTEQAIFQSSVMTEEYFAEFEEFERREYQGLLDLSKYAWIDGKKANYVTSDKRTAFLNIQGAEHAYAEYGIFAGNTSEEKEKKDIIKSNAQNFVQNGMRPSVLTKLLNSDNLEEMIDLLEIDEIKQMQMAQQGAEAEQAEKAAEIEQKDRHHQDEIQYNYDKLESDEMLKLLELETAYRDAAITETDSGMKDKYLTEANKLMGDREKLQVEREKIAMQERNNIRDNKTKLKNPVVGEKK